MLVAMWMTTDVATVRPTTSIAQTAAEMARHGFRHIVVTAEPGRGRVLGILSLHDVARAFPPDVNPLSATAVASGPSRPVQEIMSRHPRTVMGDTPIEDAARLMLERKLGALPVVHGDALVGIITRSDLLKAFSEVVGVTSAAGAVHEAGVRVTFDVSEDEDAVALVLELARTRGMRVASVVTMWHEGKRLAVARLVAGAIDDFVDAIWRSGHRVVSVLRT
jgi:acetoin utilization protein AcuB